MNTAEDKILDTSVMDTRQLLRRLDEKVCLLPVHWRWDKIEKPIVLHKILRDLTGRRATFMADYQSQKSIVKLFYGQQGLRHARREITGLELLSRCDVASSQVLHCAVLKEGVLLVLSYLHDTESLSVYWHTASQAEKRECLEQLLAQLQKMYIQGVYQDDLHLENILWDGKKVYVIDGMGIRHHQGKDALAMNIQLNNLARLFLELPFCEQTLLWQVLEESSFPFAKPHLKNKLQKSILQESRYKQGKFQHKVWRNCTHFVVGQLGDYDYAALRTQKIAFETLFYSLTQNETYCTPLKQGRTNTVFHYQADDSNWVVKRYNIKSFWHGIMRAFRVTRAASSWQNANKLQLLHILTAKPIGVLQKKWGSFRREAYFVMEYLKGQSLRQYLDSLANDAQLQDKMIIEVVQVLAALKQNRLCHGDLKADNWWVCDAKLYLLDLDSLKGYRCAWLWKRAFNSDIKRFLKNWQDIPVVQQRFMAAFKESKLI